MYEHGLGLPKDLHLAKRYYDQALDTEPAAVLPVTFALVGLWLRQHYGGSLIVSLHTLVMHIVEAPEVAFVTTTFQKPAHNVKTSSIVGDKFCLSFLT